MDVEQQEEEEQVEEGVLVVVCAAACFALVFLSHLALLSANHKLTPLSLGNNKREKPLARFAAFRCSQSRQTFALV